MATPRANGLAPKAPLRGVFPLDHHGECKEFMKAYLTCMQQHKATHHRCSDGSKDYLQCRMDRGLMREEDLETMGYAAEKRVKASEMPKLVHDEHASRERVAGLQAGDRIRKRKTVFGW